MEPIEANCNKSLMPELDILRYASIEIKGDINESRQFLFRKYVVGLLFQYFDSFIMALSALYCLT